MLLPRPRGGGSRGWVGLLLPAAALGVGVLVLRVLAGGPDALALLAAVATPVLAALRTLLAVPLWLLAWLGSGLVAAACGVLLIALAAATVAELAARVAPRWSLVVGLVALAVVDVVLVWGTGDVRPATSALHAAPVPHGLPRLQDATFGSATMGWLDFVAAALVGVVVHARTRAAAATGAAAGLWALLLLVTPVVPATVPTLAGLVAGRPRR